MYWLKIALTHNPTSMVIHNLNIIGITAFPCKTYPPLLVNANAVLSRAIPTKLLELITRRNFQGFKLSCRR